MDIVANLKKKGPAGLPLGVWAVVVVLGLYLAYRFLRGHSSGATPITAQGSNVVPNAYSTGPTGDTTGGGTKGKKKKHKKPRKHRKARIPKHRTVTDLGQGMSHTRTRAISGGSSSNTLQHPKRHGANAKGAHTQQNYPDHPAGPLGPAGLPGYGSAPSKHTKDAKEKFGVPLGPLGPVGGVDEFHPKRPLSKSDRKQKGAGHRQHPVGPLGPSRR